MYVRYVSTIKCQSNHCTTYRSHIILMNVCISILNSRLLRVKYGKKLPVCLELVLVVVQRTH